VPTPHKPHPHRPIPRQPRVVEQGARGLDIVAYKGGLVHAGVRKRSLSDSRTFGHVMKGEVKHFQHIHGLRADGIIGHHTYEHLINWVGDYGRALIAQIDHRYEARTLRARYVQNCLWSAQSHLWPYWTYAQWRPIPVNHPVRLVDAEHPVFTDCSGFAVLMARWTSGCPSPVPTYGFSGGGSTYTMEADLPHVQGTPLPGDLVLYDNPGHVVIVVGYPYAISFGSEPGPRKLDSRYRPAASFRRFLP
jgi:hypothetical protein